MRFLQSEAAEKTSTETETETESETKAEDEPLPPVLVKVFNPKEPDPKIATAMEDLEKARDKVEQAMFKKAELELKLISK